MKKLLLFAFLVSLIGCSKKSNEQPANSPVFQDGFIIPNNSNQSIQLFPNGYAGQIVTAEKGKYQTRATFFNPDDNQITLIGYFQIYDNPNLDFTVYYEMTSPEFTAYAGEHTRLQKKSFVECSVVGITKYTTQLKNTHELISLEKGFKGFIGITFELNHNILDNDISVPRFIYTDFGLGEIQLTKHKRWPIYDDYYYNPDEDIEKANTEIMNQEVFYRNYFEIGGSILRIEEKRTDLHEIPDDYQL